MADPTPPPVATMTSLPGNTADVATTAATAPTPPRPLTSTEKKNAIYDAFLLGWLLMELRGRVQVAYAQCAGPKPVSGFGLQLASQWRALFSRIASLQSTMFPNAATARTLYDPPILKYLHPTDAPDYSEVGIRRAMAGDRPLLDDFALYDELRRAINTVSLLYVTPDESLLPDDMRQFHRRVADAVLGVAESSTGATTSATDASADAGPNADRVLQAKLALTTQVCKFIDAWDGYLRENLYVGGTIPDDDVERVAYEAGYTMSGLSWSISVHTAPLEDAEQAPQASADTIAGVWRSAFRDQDIIRLQHQITAISASLDEAFYVEHPDVPRPVDGVAAPRQLDLPSEAILAVKHSIDYWQRSVDWVGRRTGMTVASQLDAWKDMRLALTEQASIWQALILGQQTLRSFNLETVTKRIMKDVTNKIQSSLHHDFTQTAEATLKSVTEEVKVAVRGATDVAVVGLQSMFESTRGFLLPAVAVLGAVGVIALVLGALTPKTEMASGIGGVAGVITAVMGWFHLSSAAKAKDAQQSTIQSASDATAAKLQSSATAAQHAAPSSASGAFLDRVGGTLNDARGMTLTAFENGYKQIRIELGALGRSTAVAYPLVELFVTTFPGADADRDFLTQIIWNRTDRDEEVERIISAAFGPLAVFMAAAKKPAGAESNAAAD